MPGRYPTQFRRKVLDLLKDGRTVTAIASDLGLSTQTIYNWRNQELVDTGQRPGLSSLENEISSRTLLRPVRAAWLSSRPKRR